MKYLLILSLLLLASCERYKRMDDAMVQDTWTGKLYMVQYYADGSYRLLEIKQ